MVPCRPISCSFSYNPRFHKHACMFSWLCLPSSLPLLLLLRRALLLRLLHKKALNPGLVTIGNGPNPLATMTEPIRILTLG